MKELCKKYQDKYNSYYEGKRKLEKKIERLEKKLENLVYPSWIDEIIKPIAEDIVKTMPDRHYKILGPFGMSCEVSIHFYIKGGEYINTCKSITFRPDSLEEGQIGIVDYSNNTKNFKEGTIGEVNGGNYKTTPMVDTLEELLEIVSQN